MAQTCPIDIAREIDRRWADFFKAATSNAAKKQRLTSSRQGKLFDRSLAGEDSGNGLVHGVIGCAMPAVTGGA